MSTKFDLIPIVGVSAAITLICIVVLTRLAEKIDLLDYPNDRKHHGEPTPLVGGLAIYCVSMFGLVIFDAPTTMIWFIMSATILVFVGVLDDAFDLAVLPRIATQILTSLLLILGAEIWISDFGFLKLEGGLVFQTASILITVLAVVGLMNSFNMIDGLDGLSTGHALITLTCVITVLVLSPKPVLDGDWLAVMFTAIGIVFVVNLSLVPIKRIFLGDAGALFLGFAISWVLIYYSQPPSSLIQPMEALWCVTVPIFDLVVIICRRLLNKRSPFFPDRLHLHHLALDLGLSHSTSLRRILLGTSLLNATGLMITTVVSPAISLCLYIAAFGGYVIFIILIGNCIERDRSSH